MNGNVVAAEALADLIEAASTEWESAFIEDGMRVGPQADFIANALIAELDAMKADIWDEARAYRTNLNCNRVLTTEEELRSFPAGTNVVAILTGAPWTLRDDEATMQAIARDLPVRVSNEPERNPYRNTPTVADNA